MAVNLMSDFIAVQISGLTEMWKAKGTRAGERLSS